MFRQSEGNLIATLIAAMTIGQIAPVFVDSADTLPDMRTSAGNTLSTGRGMQIGDYYVRQLHGSTSLISDPPLTQYISPLGMRLVSYANSVKTPLHFFLINNDEVNAFTFFGGNAVPHSALFRYPDNESQLASVMAHEIFHVTQRHLAWTMEDQQRSVSLTWVSVPGSTSLAMASPQAGVAALTDALAGACQEMISFIQQNEQEANRIGIQMLQRSGFDPQAMPTLLEKLLDQACYPSRPSEISLTHPLSESRLVDAHNRANQMWPMVVQPSEDFYLVKARTLGMYNFGCSQLISNLLDEWAKGNIHQQRVAQYGRALQAMEANKHDEAHRMLQLLLMIKPGNAWCLDLATDIDLGQNKANEATNHLKNTRDLRTSPVLRLNLTDAYLQGGQPQEAASILNCYTLNNKDDSNGWDLLARAEVALSSHDQGLATRAEGYALAGRLDQAISLLSSTGSQVKLGSLQQARYDARIDQLRQLQERFKPHTKM